MKKNLRVPTVRQALDNIQTFAAKCNRDEFLPPFLSFLLCLGKINNLLFYGNSKFLAMLELLFRILLL